MPVEIFTRDQFEAALPKSAEHLGLVDGEESYLLPITNGTGVHIRSSVGASGYSADCGENSIRCWIVDANASRKGDHRPLGNKISRWTTREPGWQARIWNPKAEKESERGVIWILANMASKIGPCPQCGAQLKVFKAKKGKPENIGRTFITCQAEGCGAPDNQAYFEWLEPAKDAAKPEPAPPPVAPKVIAPVPSQVPAKVYLVSFATLTDPAAIVKLLQAQGITATVQEIAVVNPPVVNRPSPVVSKPVVNNPPAAVVPEMDLPGACPDCGGNIVRHVCRKGKPENIGRPFCTCQGESGDGCGYLLWLDGK